MGLNPPVGLNPVLLFSGISLQTGNYMFKVNKRNIRARSEILEQGLKYVQS